MADLGKLNRADTGTAPRRVTCRKEPDATRRTRDLLRRVAARNDLVRLGARWLTALLVLAGAYAVLLLAARLFAVIPDYFEPLTLAALPAAALAAALPLGRRTSAREAGRLVDARAKTDDLFLTAALLDPSAGRPASGARKRAVGEFRPLVLRDAEETAASVRPAEVVPFRPAKGARNAALALATLLIATALLPQLDPFGKHEERKRSSRRRRRLEETRKETASRARVLREEQKTGEATPPKRAVADLKKAFKQMKPGERQGNLKRLSMEQKELGRLWRKLGEEKLRDALNQMPTFQRFGRADAGKLAEWKRELAKGKTGPLDKEIAGMRKLAEELAKEFREAKGPRERERLRRELRRRLRELAEFASSEANSKQLSRAVKRALEQLEMSGQKGLGGKALEGLMKSLALTRQEIGSLARNARELQTLEDALEAAQLAKAANAAGSGKGLDGSACSGCNSLADYAEFYRGLLERTGQGRGAGPGMGGPGIGEGGLADEDGATETSFQTKLSKSKLTAGRMLLKWKTKGLTDPGRAREEYRKGLQDVKQNASEAVIREQVPPGYRDAIRKYFDTFPSGDGRDDGRDDGGDDGKAGGAGGEGERP